MLLLKLKTNSKKCIIILSLLFITYVSTQKISTPQGEIEGILKKTISGREIEAFLGIPFAKPPIGELRFKGPVPFGNWEGIRNASKDGNGCIQPNLFTGLLAFANLTLRPEQMQKIIGSEDCLYLNVYSPSTSVPKKYPVMVFIHGGAFVYGSSESNFYGPDLLLDKEDVVLVATNYRVGPLGFASTEDTVMPGNYGMKDLVSALKWVQENIAAYGGNPDSVTIFGESAGSACVHYLTISPLAKGLFHRAIAMSGTAHCPWALFAPGAVAKNTQKLASFLNCPTEPSNDLVDCLSKVPAEQLIESLDKFMIWKTVPFVSHVPVVEPQEVEDAFITVSPLEAKSDVPMMIGITKDEGVMFVSVLGTNDDNDYLELNKHINDILPVGLFYDKSSNNPDKVTKKIREFYFGGDNTPITPENIKGLMNIFGDSLFVQCTSSAVENHEGPAYLYVFAYKGSKPAFQFSPNDYEKYGVSHGEDLRYVFSMNLPSFENMTKLSENDKKMSEEMIKLLTNFAKHGNPTPDSSDVKWDKLSIKNMNYYHIEHGKLRMEEHFFKERVNFWKQLEWRSKMKPKNLKKTEL